MMDLLFVGVGWTDLAITLNRIAVGAFFMLSGHRKLFNAERHRSMVDELKALGVPAVGFNQWWGPLVEFTAGGAVLSHVEAAGHDRVGVGITANFARFRRSHPVLKCA
jgi:hypothetical protein